jgi:acyl-CoA dehydrogenase
MTSLSPHDDPHSELRDGVRALCAQFDSAYWQKVDEARGYPEHSSMR